MERDATRQGIFRPQRRGGAAEARYARHDVVVNSQFVQPVHLFPDCPVNAGVPGVQPDGRLSRFFRTSHRFQNFFQGHFRAVEDSAVFPAAFQQGRIHEAPRVNHLVGCLQQFRPSQRNQIRRTGTCPDEMNHVFPPKKKSAPEAGYANSRRRMAPVRLCFRFRQKHRLSPMYLTDPLTEASQ